MVLLDLVVSADVENVQALSYGGAVYEWHFTIKCSKCQHINEDEVYFSGEQQLDIPDSRGTCNFVMKCKLCKCAMNFTYLADGPTQVHVFGDKIKPQTLARFECRGGEPIAWNAQGLTVVSVSGAEFDDCDLTDTWTDYDESKGENCLVDQFKYEFVRAKGK